MNLTIAMTLVFTLIACTAAAARPIVIAHRGASGYLPEHTLEGKAMAYAQKPDYIEQDVALSRDGIPHVLHDHYLDTVTDVARVFPQAKRADGRYYAIDLTAAQIARLTVHERIDLATGHAVYPKRFPTDAALPFRVPTLDQELTMIRGLNASTGRDTGIYVELKVPWFHKNEKADIEHAVLSVLERHGYTKPGARAYIQCFDPASLQRLRAMHVSIPLVQLIGHNEWNETPGVDYDRMLTTEGLQRIAAYAQGIGPSIDQMAILEHGRLRLRTDLVRAAHAAGLVVHPYTVRVDDLPAGVSAERLLDVLFGALRVDGVFSDFPDVAVDHVQRRGYR